MIFHESGIISDMLVEYQDFSVTQKLIALEKIDAVSCDTVSQPEILDKSIEN